MSKKTAIGWTHHTMNPWWGCSKISPGCDLCYADTFAARCGFTGKPGAKGITKPVIWGPAAARRFFGDAHWREPEEWNAAGAFQCRACGSWHGKGWEGKKCQACFADATGPDGLPVLKAARPRVFCGSMCDWLEDREDLTPHLARLLALIHATPNLDWQLLSKRPENWGKRMGDILNWIDRESNGLRDKEWLAAADARNPFLANDWLAGRPPANVWIGCTIENQKYLDIRYPHLVAIPANVRFFSAEPLLEPLCFRPRSDSLSDKVRALQSGEASRPALLDGIAWVIVGGESGGTKVKPRRPFEAAWAEGIAAQCDAAGCAVFIKQAGGRHS